MASSLAGQPPAATTFPVTPSGYGRPMNAHHHDLGLPIVGAGLLLVALPTASIWLSVLGLGCVFAGARRLARAARHP